MDISSEEIRKIIEEELDAVLSESNEFVPKVRKFLISRDMAQIKQGLSLGLGLGMNADVLISMIPQWRPKDARMLYRLAGDESLEPEILQALYKLPSTRWIVEDNPSYKPEQNL